MPNIPLLQDTLWGGRIYLKGETMYPDEMATDMAKKVVPQAVSSPIFRSSELQPTAPAVPPVPGSPVGESSVPAVPTANTELINRITIDPNWQDDMESHELPADFPYREIFVEAGYDSIELVNNLNNYTEVDGIGPARSMEVAEWMSANIDTGNNSNEA